MSTDTISSTRQRARSYFRNSFKPRTEHLVGMEVEHICIRAKDGQRIAYDSGDGCIVELLPQLQQVLGGTLVKEDGKFVGVNGDWGKVTLEPGNQIEWSSPARPTCHQLLQDLDHWIVCLQNVLQENDVHSLATGLDSTDVANTPWVPKRRYNIMKDYYRGTAGVAHRAMLNTAGIHVNVDYENDDDWSRKFSLMIRATPAAAALFANSAGTFHDLPYAALRPMLWHEMDPLRSRLPSRAFHQGFRLEHWADWVTERPMLLQILEGELQPGRNHRLKDIPEADWEESWNLHLGTVFTPVRTNRQLEIRTMDTQPMDNLPAVPAFWTGLLYSPDVLDAALTAVACVNDEDAWRGLMARSCRFGLADPELESLAEQLLTLAHQGIQQLEGSNSRGADALSQLMQRHRRVAMQSA